MVDLIQNGIAPLLIGMDAMQVEACWQRAWLVLAREFGRGTGNSIMPQFARAVAATRAALWGAGG